jgi:hypothetical protein
MAAHLGAEGRGYANLYESGLPIYSADRSTPRHAVECTMPWGDCELERESVPIPDGAVPARNVDGHMAVIDWSTRKAYEFWQAQKVDGTWKTSWGGVVDIDGEGRPGAAVGAGVSLLAGIVRTFEIAGGRIEHALTFTTDACPHVYRYPATKSDGTASPDDCIPEGARIQLDPSIDVDAIPGITPGERAVARALQVYGGYAVDNGGAVMGFGFENPVGKADPYPAAGFEWDYWHMPHIPWDRLRVLRQWDGR